VLALGPVLVQRVHHGCALPVRQHVVRHEGKRVAEAGLVLTLVVIDPAATFPL